MDNTCKKASEFLKILVDNMVNEKILKADSLLKTWKNIVGDKISSHSKLVDISSGNLIVETDHPGWSQQILFKKKKIIEAVNNLFPEAKVRNIFIKVIFKEKNSEFSGKEKESTIETGFITKNDKFSPDETYETNGETDEKELLFNQFQKLRKTLELNERRKNGRNS